jgi:hypothetical protein
MLPTRKIEEGNQMGWNLPPGCTDADVDRASPGCDEGMYANELETLHDLCDYLQNMADASLEDGQYRPNEEMRLLVRVKDAIAKLEGKQ